MRFKSLRSSWVTRREIPPPLGLFGISTRKRPARLMKVVSDAPLLPRSSLLTCTNICWPSLISWSMRALLSGVLESYWLK